MSTVYAIQFDIVPSPDADIIPEYQHVKKRVSEWVIAAYDRKWNTRLIFPSSDEPVTPLMDHIVQSSDVRIGESEMQRTRWQHPDGNDRHLRWSTDIVVARTSKRVQFGIKLDVSSTAYVVRPPQINLGRPRLVSELLERHSCWVGQQPLLAKKLEISPQDVEEFVQDELLDAERPLPFVLVSHDQFTDRPVLDADGLHDSLRGFAQVAVLDKWAAFRLTDILGRQLSCFNGCVRIYWPGLKRDSNPLHHRLYFPLQILRFEYQKRPLNKHLFDLLARISATRFTDADIVREIQARIEAERALESIRVQKQLQEGRVAALSLQDVEDLLDLAIKENSDLNSRVTNLVAENEALAAQLSDVRANFNLLQQYQSIDSEDATATEQPPVAEFDTVSAALAKALEDFGDDLLVVETATESASTSDFARPEVVYQALMAIRDVGRLYFESIDTESSLGSWKDQLAQRGFTQYSPTESETVKNDHRRYGKYREFLVDGKKRRIYSHLDVGGGDRKNCLQIYFEPDSKLRRVIVAHCGAHLPFPRQRT